MHQSLLDYGLFGSPPVVLCASDIREFGLADNRTGLLLVGNRGSSYWPFFCQSPEFVDGEPDPLDRWSKRVAELLCLEYSGLQPLFPSDGPPWLPFQRWALLSGELFTSPLGLLIHPDYGLWHSFRFALLFDHDQSPVGLVDQLPTASPCDGCADKPCLNTCPVNAFTTAGYDVLSCARYLEKNRQASCHQLGCEARNACPVGPGYRYQAAQHRFHLQAFLRAR